MDIEISDEQWLEQKNQHLYVELVKSIKAQTGLDLRESRELLEQAKYILDQRYPAIMNEILNDVYKRRVYVISL